MDNFIKWEPVPHIGKYQNISFSDTSDKLFVILESVESYNKNIIITFKQRFDGYRFFIGKARKKFLEKITQKYKDNFFDTWPLFQVSNSSYAQSLSVGSNSFYEKEWFCHYVFITENIIFEICGHFPTVEFID